MAIATERIIPGVLPPKEETEGVDFLSIYDEFDASKLSDSQLEQFAPRQPYVTAYPPEEGYYNFEGDTFPIPNRPIEERLRHGEFCVGSYRRDIEEALASTSVNWYKNARAALIQAIGMKACTEYVRREYNKLSEAEKQEDFDNWNRWSRYCDMRRNNPLFDKDIEDMTDEEIDELLYGPEVPEGYTGDYEWHHHQDYIPIMSVKIKRLRKGTGLTQRDFAKQIGYNVNKYALLEQGKLEKLGLRSLEEAFPVELVKKIVDLTYANPYWLLDDTEESLDDVDEEETAMTVEDAIGDDWTIIPMFADAKVIRWWWAHRGV